MFSNILKCEVFYKNFIKQHLLLSGFVTLVVEWFCYLVLLSAFYFHFRTLIHVIKLQLKKSTLVKSQEFPCHLKRYF